MNEERMTQTIRKQQQQQPKKKEEKALSCEAFSSRYI